MILLKTAFCLKWSAKLFPTIVQNWKKLRSHIWKKYPKNTISYTYSPIVKISFKIRKILPAISSNSCVKTDELTDRPNYTGTQIPWSIVLIQWNIKSEEKNTDLKTVPLRLSSISFIFTRLVKKLRRMHTIVWGDTNCYDFKCIYGATAVSVSS